MHTQYTANDCGMGSLFELIRIINNNLPSAHIDNTGWQTSGHFEVQYAATAVARNVNNAQAEPGACVCVFVGSEGGARA